MFMYLDLKAMGQTHSDSLKVIRNKHSKPVKYKKVMKMDLDL